MSLTEIAKVRAPDLMLNAREFSAEYMCDTGIFCTGKVTSLSKM